ncbi:hypothetical protein EMIHUDRAFT_106329 [Emiliania huxleyi CCMP1516]|uniref:Sulfotransferase domain-containing protein n=2 Tax=Emiliania huxleyi TaxID=2903 RepID=A0A0D3I9Q6_EMIH1|nr:hypothetical protein EMIHUDRAFT_106329 [Emiliania huxleyi CCMP1516]EOD07991.1 hypothetical protein EMIHUDRAFT_106329 [Emiliania huxleyi CCMP1516]|eukprot:XP_005760420.1 hypothetical protein EMIHUDRAFT_106329 [Emiliania huxleyi CCMP1516]
MGGGCSSGCGGCSPVLEHELRRSNSVRPDQLRAHGGDQSFRVLHDRKDWLTVVFLRDPVERFVSGYLDKCRPTIARGERHCEPLGLYINGTHSEFMRLLPHARMQLGSYVDTFPLTWNLHFFPQSLYCDDLGRNAHKYTFRGALNASLADQVGALGRLIDARALAATPGSAPKHVGQGAAAASFKTDNDSGEHKTDAAARLAGLVATESAARRLLEYYAIDYVELGLELPSFLVKLPLPALSRNTTLTFFLRAMPPSVTLPAAERHDELIDAALYKLVGGARVGAAGTRWERACKQARLPVKMGGMGLTSAVDIREPAWIGTWALVAGPMRHLHAPFRDLDVSKAPGSDFDELRAAHDRLKKEHGEIAATWKEWDDKTKAEYFDLVGAAALAEFTSKHEFLHQAQRRFTTVVHNRNWRDLAEELAKEGSAGSRSAPRGKKGKARAEGRERGRIFLFSKCKV